MPARPLALLPPPAAPPPRPDPRAEEAELVALLLRRRAVAPSAAELARTTRAGPGLAATLLARGEVDPAALLAAQSSLRRARILDPEVDPPDPRLVARLGPEACLRDGLLPWRQAGAVTVVATARPDLFAAAEPQLAQCFGPVALALAPEPAIARALLRLAGPALAERAETRVAAAESCRSWSAARLRAFLAILLAALALLALAAPRAPVLLFTAWASLTLVATTALKLAAAAAELRARLRPAPAPPPVAIARPPTVSLLVPLFHEPDIAPRLVARLGRLDYPPELTDILLIVEAEDAATRAALATAALPPTMRVIAVPPGRLHTKPRALNYALPFCRGTIVGVYDAEDAPSPDQLARVVERFASRGPRVACLQGVLDFYNPATNWLSRCFTVEYAAWFRIVLPGLARMGFTIPLGGTTLFFRRAALVELGGWDAHNVTEDADLGLRLARHGYRTELIDVVTEEEANCRTRPWIRQRSRWLKGYMITWATHMRAPLTLHRQLGAKRFWGVQVLFLGTLTQFLLAPLLWSCWVMLAGLPHPLDALPPWALATLTSLFVAAEVVNVAVNAAAVSGPKHRWLIPWVPTLAAYFPLAALAAWKGAWELAGRPFFWDKTAHGAHQPDEPLPEPAAAAPEGLALSAS